MIRFLLAALFAVCCFTSPATSQIHEPLDGPPGEEIARLRVQVPDRATFQVWGTLPVPEGIAWSAAPALTVLDQNGAPRVTQAETIRWRADGSAAVLEVSASVDRGDLVPGDFVEFVITDRAQPWGGLPHVSAAVVEMVGKDWRAYVRATDLEGRVWAASLGRSFVDPTSRIVRWGPARATVRVHSWLSGVDLPANGPPAPRLYPFFGSASAYWTGADGAKSVELDLQFANASTYPLETLWLESLELVLPAGWNAASLNPDPYLGEPYSEPGLTVIPLAKPSADGTLHALRWGDRHAWRLAVYPDGAADEAAEILARKGWGVAAAGEAPSGSPLWSWGTTSTAGFLPQGEPVPNLSEVAGLDNRKRSRWASISEALRDGSTYYFKPGTAPRLGAFFHSYGSSYGGMTGGGDIWPFGGAEFAWVDRRPGAGPPPEGLLWLEALAGMNIDRQRGILMAGDGLPLSASSILPDNLDESPSWRRYRSPGVPTWNKKNWPAMKWGRHFEWLKGDPFGQDAEGEHPATALAFSSGRVPSTYWNHEDDSPGPAWSWGAIDFQHGIRFLWPLQTLFELSGDPLAREWIQGEAQIARMERHLYGGTDFDQLVAEGKEDPGRASVHAGRDTAHAFNLWAYAYSISTPGARDKWRPELVAALDALVEIQTPFGVYSASPPGKAASAPPMNGLYRVAASIQSSFVQHALLGLEGAVVRGVDPDRSALVDLALVRHGVGVVSWGWLGGATYFRAAIAPVDGGPLFLDAPAVQDHHNATTIPGPMAIALRRATGEDRAALLDGFRGLLGLPSETSLEELAAAFSKTPLAHVADRAIAISIIQELAK